MSDIIAYTDGACSGNPGRGGYGLVIIDGDTEYRFSEGPFRKTTNNRMELKAFIKTLEFLSTKRNFESLSIIIRVDSKYVSDGITKWAYNWSKNNFSGRLNSDLWIQAWSLRVTVDMMIIPRSLRHQQDDSMSKDAALHLCDCIDEYCLCICTH